MNIKQFNIDSEDRVFVVFQEETSLWWLRLLKKNFRHCFLLFKESGANTYLELNPYSNQFVFIQHKVADDFDYIGSLEEKGKLVCEVSINDNLCGAYPWFFFTCVEFAKRALGIYNIFVITPFQLYKAINKINN